MKGSSSQYNFTYRYIDDVLSIINPYFEYYLGQMYRPELDIKDTTESNTSASYLDLLLSICRDGQLCTSLYEKRDDFNFIITNFSFLSSNIPSSPASAVSINVSFRGRCDFPISFSGRDMLMNVHKSLLESCMFGTEILSNNMRSPSLVCYMAFWRMTIYSDTLH